MLEWIISSSVLIAVIILLRFLLKGKLSLRLQYALWALVLVRLLVPFSFGSSSISVMGSVEQSTVYQTASNVITTVQVPSDIIRDSELTIEEAQKVGQGTIYKVEDSPVESGGETLHTYSFQDSLKDVGSRVLRIVWLWGMAIVGLWFAGSNLTLAIKLRKSRTVHFYEECPLPVHISDAVDTPCLFGLIRPAIYLTKEAASDASVARHAIEHELTHFRHRDNLWAILRGVCLAIHWYNPLVWWAAILSRNDAELACDEATIRRLGESERAAYGKTLIGLTCKKRTALLNTATTMTGSGKSIKERIVLIARKPHMAIYTLVVVVLVAAIAVGCTFTGAKEPPASSAEETTSSEDETTSSEDETTSSEDEPVATLPVLELSREEYDAVCTAVLIDLKTGWWKGGALADCVYDAAAFECVYRQTEDHYERFYGYAGYFRFDQDGNCVEHWYSPTIVTLDADTQQIYGAWWPGDGAYHESDILARFPDEIAEFVAEPNAERYQIILGRLMLLGQARMEAIASYRMSSCLSGLTQEWQHRLEQNNAPIRFLRVDKNRERELTVDGNILSVLSSAGNKLQNLDDPDNFRTLGGVYVRFDNTRHLAFFAGEDPFQVKLQYVADDVDESAVVYDYQLYLYLVASAEQENVQLADLDQDGLFEAILRQSSENNLIVYACHGDVLLRIDANQAIGCVASDYAGLIANIKPEYSRMIRAQSADGTVRIYRYHNGIFDYVCPLSEALDNAS